ncbi:Glycosyltransferase involved in cell wall biogenesis-like protein [Rubellimicrobium mesophilum DSM 19309]|uniref:Glycosyltransferase involved in cell wall biogenesis-like protein n=1 Tax=Rubellimicrobium mesophilum DSM 19309 TaxID=442562 RepID=A0A017HP66_9RHOB|nr:glycosyltransferase family A protein [Rubellimicrobium mesophilum]EYD75958.1 Glycosyltransferase involved in cell wall biogenesis-like protein [Rubellimicrobium mesophilum DSM 19309]
MARVSAIIIFLNEERFLAEAIASVRAQTFDDWELILVDDGSTDASPSIAHAVAAQDPRIRVVTHPGGENRGMSASRNRGLAEARGDYVAFLDGDDVWLPQKLAEQVAILDAEPRCGMLYGRTMLWHSWNPEAADRDGFLDLGVEPGRSYDPPVLYRLLLRNRAQAPTTNNAILRRSLADQVGGFEDEFRTLFEDQVFYVKTHLAAPCFVDDRVWAWYRQHPRSSTSQVHPLRELAALARFHRWVGGYLRAHYPGRRDLWLSLLAARVDCRLRQARAMAGFALGRG